jgi:hypothetical protein
MSGQVSKQLDDDIYDGVIGHFLKHLAKHRIEGLVIFGGAIRDWFLGKKIRDLDVAVVLPTGPIVTCGLFFSDYLKIPTLAHDRYNQLAISLGLGSAQELLESKVTFEGVPVDIIGCRVVTYDNNEYPDIYVLQDGTSVLYPPGSLTINGMGIGPGLKLYGEKYKSDLDNRLINFASPLRIGRRSAYNLGRILVYSKRYRLRFTSESAGHIIQHIKNLLRAFDSFKLDFDSNELEQIFSQPETEGITIKPKQFLKACVIAFDELGTEEGDKPFKRELSEALNL